MMSNYHTTLYLKWHVHHDTEVSWNGGTPKSSSIYSRFCHEKKQPSFGVQPFVETLRSLEHIRTITWLVVWNMFYFSLYREQSSQLTFIFFREVFLNHPSSSQMFFFRMIWDVYPPFSTGDSDFATIHRIIGMFTVLMWNQMDRQLGKWRSRQRRLCQREDPESPRL